SVLAYLPGETQQREVLQAVAASPAEFDAERVKSTFLSELDKQRMNPAAFDEFLGRLDRFLGPEQPLRLQDLENRGLDRLLGRYVRSDEGRVRIVTYVFLADARWKRQPPPGFVNALTGDDARIVITGTNVVSKEFRRIFSREAPRAVALGLVVVFVLLWIDFRSLRLTSIALAQLVCGVIMMLGMMRVLDVPLNYVNAFVATMILGVGIDYSIHIVHRFTLSDGLVEEGLLETGKAVVMAALTNIAGFGTLWFGNYPALRSFGQVALIGSLTCLLTALTLVPAIMGRQQKG
ncbi:MAG: MMPL family transporter, partial [Acidobacteriota bacterium]|nr:MMPL family transporter [Acidobacteriota bacterium]